MTFTTRLARAIGSETEELGAALTGAALLFCLFAGYFMLRPVREAMGIAGGVDNLQWLFSATFVVMLLAVPLLGWLGMRVPRRRFVDWAYAFFASNLLLLALLFAFYSNSVWLARAFYVWLSVYNLFVVSLAWSLMADVFDTRQARRLFAFIAAGASIGGLCGPLLSVLLIGVIGEAGLLMLAAVLLGVALFLKHNLLDWRERHGAGRPGAPLSEELQRPLPGNPFSGLSRVLSSRYLSAIAVFVLLLTAVSTFLYFEQARLVAELFPQRSTQVQVFGVIDALVQAGSLTAQLFISGRVAQRYGLRALLCLVPALVCLGFLGLALAPTFAVLATLMIVRRIGEYAFIRPGREMLFAPLDAESKYKAKNVIDTLVYRGGDALSGWLKAGLDSLGLGALPVALAGAACAALWAMLGWYLGGPRKPQ